MISLAERIRKNKYIVGSWINSASPIIAEIMAQSGYDFLTIDAEHSAVDLYQIQGLLQAITSGNPDCAPLVRIPASDPFMIKRYLDAGAAGIIAPLVNDAETAREIVSAAQYPPDGTRGVGFSRSNSYGVEFHEHIPADNEKIFVCIQIEHIDGVNNIESILDVPGIGGVFIGPYDLSASMGLPGQLDHPKLLATIDKILEACNKKEIPVGSHIVQPDIEAIQEQIKAGFQIIAFSLDIVMIANISEKCLKALGK